MPVGVLVWCCPSGLVQCWVVSVHPDLPVAVGLEAVVPAAQAGEVGGGGEAAGGGVGVVVGGDVVEVAGRGGGGGSGEAAVPVPGTDEPGQGGGGGVAQGGGVGGGVRSDRRPEADRGAVLGEQALPAGVGGQGPHQVWVDDAVPGQDAG